MCTDFSKITPCGGNCPSCGHFKNGECKGCLANGGICVSMWEKECEIFKCCEKHSAKFCGLCENFPCEWIVGKLGEWDSGGIERQKKPAEEYKSKLATLG